MRMVTSVIALWVFVFAVLPIGENLRVRGACGKAQIVFFREIIDLNMLSFAMGLGSSYLQ